MYGPYREPDRSSASEPRRDPDAAFIYALLALLGIGRVVAALALSEPFGAETTVASAFAVTGVVGLFGSLGLLRRRRRAT